MAESGHQDSLASYYLYEISRNGENSYNRLNTQIVQEARKTGEGHFSYNFIGSYDFGSYQFVFGKGVVSGIFSGTARRNADMLIISGEITYSYHDTFTDPASIREVTVGNSKPSSSTFTSLSDLGGKRFDIVGEWKASFNGQVNADEKNSRY